MSVAARLFGDLSGLRAVKGILSSLVLSLSFFSNDANSGSWSPGPLAPLTMGTVGSSAEATTGAGLTCASRL